jgi:hypothetical protein
MKIVRTAVAEIGYLENGQSDGFRCSYSMGFRMTRIRGIKLWRSLKDYRYAWCGRFSVGSGRAG